MKNATSPALAVFFHPKMVVDIIFETPSPRKPAEVVAQWQQRYPIALMDFAPVSTDDFYLAHAKEHIDGLLALTIKNGMDTNDQEVIDSLPWTVGSMLAAAKHALQHHVAVSPTSGFHHAGYDFSWGFCTVNGLLITARKLLQEGLVKRVGILDFDQHHGDGSEDILRRLNTGDEIVHITGRTDYVREAEAFFAALPALFKRLASCELVLYQAGADQHIEDPLGGFLDNAQLRERDRRVFEFCHAAQIPLVWNLAGGYQEVVDSKGERSIQKVLDIHNATLEECLRVYC